ncbi:hypothetical protein ONZ45_g459 [Pleurotus djamor]|nr:hypothetical protein ONZ45_g459 [Pleurotus djamor]
MNKRILSDNAYQSGAASDQPHASTPPDLAAALRSVGARARKSVTEGYATNRYFPSASQNALEPPSRGGQLFRSAHDTLREVYSSPHLQFSNSSSSKKRSLNLGNPDEERGTHSDTEMDAEPTVPQNNSNASNRVVKPLRKSRARALMQTQSLPTNAFQFSGGSVTETSTSMLDSIGEKHVYDDDDWSAEAFQSSGISSFQPGSP